MKAEEFGEHDCGQLGGQVDQGGVAAGAGVDAEPFEAYAELLAAEVPAGARLALPAAAISG